MELFGVVLDSPETKANHRAHKLTHPTTDSTCDNRVQQMTNSHRLQNIMYEIQDPDRCGVAHQLS